MPKTNLGKFAENLIKALFNLKVSEGAMIAALSAYFTLALNLSFWKMVFGNIEIGGAFSFLFLLSLPVCMFLVKYAVFNMLLWPRVFKPVAALLLLVSSAANYFMFKYGIFIDAEMVRNTVETTVAESVSYLTPGLVLWIFFGGVLPSVIIVCARIGYGRTWRLLLVHAARVLLSLAVVVAVAAACYKQYVFFMRNNDAIRKLVNPENYIYAIQKYFYNHALANSVFTVIDPAPSMRPRNGGGRRVIVLVVGETARRGNFSLNGYGRETNPLLKRQDVVSFADVASAGTSTAVSVPAMFSALPRTKFKVDDADYIENLLDILKKAGWSVVWIENNSSCKKVCARVDTEYIDAKSNPEFCDGSNCHDGVMLDALDRRIRGAKGGVVVVLHAIGSHGPAYYERYPERFKVFAPTCDTAELQDCAYENIINTYDNTILYTDYFLNGVIEVLKRFPAYETGMLYVSDHGESLGEGGIYLHGMPYMIAPSAQKTVPMIMWMNEKMRRGSKIDYGCLKASAARELSHDYFFHTTLGWAEVDSQVYDPSLDFLKDCRFGLADE
ncbi:MAG: phosphoethanolamine--lipid A transferase [Rickettsiales bacterium]|nr:phosphoethanolamine--lipid A transferase [Rickettsiales bacterium]